MKIDDFEIECKKYRINWRKKYLKNMRLIGLIYPALILGCSVNLYIDPSSWLSGVTLGINICTFFFYIMDMIEHVAEYRRDCRILEWYETEYKKITSDNP